jgi:hypothetical protein
MAREIVHHSPSGERYILETTETPGGNVYRAAGPLHHSENPSDDEMQAWLDNQGQDAYNDGEWLSREMTHA